MLILICDHCGRTFAPDEGLLPGDDCPADDCPADDEEDEEEEPPNPEALDLQRWRDLAERALRALNEDDFPQLRQDLRDALGTT